MQFAKQNSWFGVRTSATLSSLRVWEKMNKIAGVLLVFLGSLLFILNLIAYTEGWIWQLRGVLIISILALATGISIFALIYGDKLVQEEQKKGKLKPFTVSKALVFAFAFISFSMGTVGFSLAIGSEKLDLRILGICFMLVGLVFAFVFLSAGKKEESIRVKMFESFYSLFVVLTVILSVILVLL